MISSKTKFAATARNVHNLISWSDSSTPEDALSYSSNSHLLTLKMNNVIYTQFHLFFENEHQRTWFNYQKSDNFFLYENIIRTAFKQYLVRPASSETYYLSSISTTFARFQPISLKFSKKLMPAYYCRDIKLQLKLQICKSLMGCEFTN